MKQLVASLKVRLGSNSYPILIGYKHLHRLGRYLKEMDLGTDPVVLSNAKVLNHIGPSLRVSLDRAGLPMHILTVPDSERSKSLRTLTRLLNRLAGLDGPGKRLFLILAGGGVIGDLGGVAAGLYRRGIPFVQLPTTLLAQVDSAIGGKTGVDLPQGKNLVGLFYQPRMVFVEIGFLDSLSDRQFRSGLAEVLKCAILQDPVLFRFMETVDVDRLRKDRKRLIWMIMRAIRVKVRLVEKDERETRGLRTLLNLGHTLGHAIEAASNYRRDYTHGEAVALGIRAVTDMAWWMGEMSSDDRMRIHRAINRLGLPSHICGLRLAKILRAMEHDKKWTLKRNRWVLPIRIGHSVVRCDVPDKIVYQAVRGLLK